MCDWRRAGGQAAESDRLRSFGAGSPVSHVELPSMGGHQHRGSSQLHFPRLQ